MLQANRTRLEKATDAAHARNKASFAPPTTAPAPKTKRRIAIVNASAGDAILERSRPTAHRQSMRKHTILNTSQTETRLKRSEEKRVSYSIFLLQLACLPAVIGGSNC